MDEWSVFLLYSPTLSQWDTAFTRTLSEFRNDQDEVEELFWMVALCENYIKSNVYVVCFVGFGFGRVEEGVLVWTLTVWRQQIVGLHNMAVIRRPTIWKCCLFMHEERGMFKVKSETKCSGWRAKSIWAKEWCSALLGRGASIVCGPGTLKQIKYIFCFVIYINVDK